ncbi:hypothetical protein DLAC_00541 [Tieghemostelium lacteum]|uniref:B box-type domain-containing protein n=1 Tax=Tieghemostelium lacteum TaxID=361077 RepID=A0A152AA05_TIELA|nr:hypothetical protein DLAC_00541 [Tieghemostelium lacteum]|eukprot:KYR03050.1 hypothetical protein DLAC_00541 [Tieghemostelium lacteum]
METCTKDKHLQEVILYCLECKNSVCVSCTKDHRKHDMIDLESYKKELAKDLDVIKNKAQDRINQLSVKQSENKAGQLLVEDSYNDYKNLIENIFKKIFDGAHIKQAELQRKLKSLYDDIIEKYTIQESSIDNEINQLKKSLETTQLISSLEYLNSTINTTLQNNQVTNFSSQNISISMDYKQQHEFILNQIKEFQMKFQLNNSNTNISNNINNININNNNYNYLVKFSHMRNYFKFYNIDLNQFYEANILTPVALNQQIMETHSPITVNNCVYLFSDRVYKLDLTANEYRLEYYKYQGPYQMPSRFTSIYGGNGSFYIFCLDRKRTFQLDLNTFTLSYLGASCDLPFLNINSLIGIHREQIFVLDSTNLHSLNLWDKTIKSQETNRKVSIKKGCYVPDKTFYAISFTTNEVLWLRFNIDDLKWETLKATPSNFYFSENCRFQYRPSNHSIFVIDLYDSLFSYDIKSDTWTKQGSVDSQDDSPDCTNYYILSNYFNPKTTN